MYEPIGDDVLLLHYRNVVSGLGGECAIWVQMYPIQHIKRNTANN
jgi:hypothetical protein